MIHERERNVEVTSTLTGTTIAMGIDPGAMAHLMNLLTDLYSDPEAAIIREISTNAADAHVEAGQIRPIEVSTPSALSPFFRVRDFGIGLTVTDIHEIYSQYGASTKRGTNDQVGMLGLGCKSPLTYSDQFTLSSVKDGVKITVIVSRDEHGTGGMTVLETETTDAPDGTEVVIPAKRHNNLHEKAEEFFSVWPFGSVLLNGEEPPRFEGLKVTDNIYIVEGESRVVMGNVAYPADFSLARPAGLGHMLPISLLAFVPIGDVLFTPSREALNIDAPATKATLGRVAAEYSAAIPAAAQAAVDAEPSAPEALAALADWSRYLPNTDPAGYDYRGTPIPPRYEIPSAGPVIQSTQFASRYYTPSVGRSHTVRAYDWPDALWVTGFVPAKFTSPHRQKIQKYCEAHGIDTDGVSTIMADPTSGPTSEFIDPARIIPWGDVRQVKLDRQASSRAGASGRLPGSYDVFVGAVPKIGMPGNDIDQSKPIFWINANWRGSRPFAEALAQHCVDFMLVCLPANRVEKFKRDLPAAIPALAGVEAAAATYVAALTEDQRTALAIYDARQTERLQEIDAQRVDDPALQHTIRVAWIDVAPLVGARRYFRAVVTEEFAAEWRNPLEDYSLFSPTALAVAPDETYDYLNWAYARRLTKPSQPV